MVAQEDRDLYEVLGVSRGATSAEIDAAYKRLVRLTHPDAGGTNALFRQVQNAYEVLSDPARRAIYDRGADQPHPQDEPPRASGSGWTRVDTGPSTAGYPPPRPGPSSRPSPTWGPGQGGPRAPGWGPGAVQPPPSYGAPSEQSGGYWNAPSPPAFTSRFEPQAAARPSQGYLASRPWVVLVGIGVVLMALGSFSPGISVLGFIVLIAGAIAGAGSRKARSRLALRSAQVGQTDHMDGTTFEHFVAELLRSNGYRVDHVGQTGDYGADLIISNGTARWVVQTKRYSAQVGVDAVREAAAARAHYAAQGAIVITNSYFTPQAVKLARSNAVELWDRNVLVRLASKNVAVPPTAAPAVLGLELLSGVAFLGRLVLSVSASSPRRRRRPRRRR